MNLLFEVLIIFLGTIVLLLSLISVIRLRQPTTLPLWALKVMASGLSTILFVTGLVIVLLGWMIQSNWAMSIGTIGALIYLFHIIRITQPDIEQFGFEKAFGKGWEKQIPNMSVLKNWYEFIFPKKTAPLFHQNIPFYTIAGTDRQLICDLWQPPKNITSSGLAFIYLHGSAWAVLDKDFGTRKFFRHLANQGHLIMDVAYRLFPETDMMGMVYDAKHAIAWLKNNAALYNINPEKIVIGGGSAGAHIALLSAYSLHHEELIPAELANSDLSVAGVISLYGQANLKTTYYHTAQHLSQTSAISGKKQGEKGGMPSWISKSLDIHRLGFDKNVEPGMLSPMLDGSPEEKPEAYAFYSPMEYVDASSPPTLIVHGKHDILAPVEAMRKMYFKLIEQKVPAVMHLIPQTDHAFDLIFPQYSPSAQNAIYDVDRFLAFIAGRKVVEAEIQKSDERFEQGVLQYV